MNEHTALRGIVEIIPVKFRHGDLPRPIYMKAGENGLFRCLSDIEIGEVMNQEEMRGNNKKPFEFK